MARKVTNMKTNLIKILVLVLLSLNGYAQDTSKAPRVESIAPAELNGLLGEWTGTLTYIDYSSNKPYTMPANLTVKQGNSERQFLLFNTYPNEPKANSKGKVMISKNGNQLDNKEVISKQKLANGHLEIITEYTGQDNRKQALIRVTYILGEKLFVIRKDVQFEQSDDWIKRNEYRYTR